MNFLDQPLSFTRTSRISRSPAQYAASIERTGRSGSPLLRAAVFVLVAAILVIAATA